MSAADPRALLARAVELAAQGMRSGAGGPFGAVVARGEEIVGEGFNQVTSTFDPSAHAEVVALRAAGQRLATHDLSGCTLYSSCEPCPMCLSAAFWARVERVYFASSRHDAAAVGFEDAALYDEVARPLAARKLPLTRFESPEADAILREWEAMPDKVRY